MMSEFDMTDFSVLHYFLGLEVFQDDDNIFIVQNKYILDMLKKLNMLNINKISTPINISEKSCIIDGTTKINEHLFRRIVGRSIYLTHIRPDSIFSVSTI